MRVVINACFGGYSVSLDAARRMAELGHDVAVKEVVEYDEACAEFERTGVNPQGGNSDYFRSRPPQWYGYNIGREDADRADPILVRVVEEMGARAGGDCAALEVVEVPDDASWHIEEYDGNEHVAEDHRTWP